jgi:Na+/H+ antiporter NhaA
MAGLLFLVLVALRAARVSDPSPYVVVAVLLWLATYASGVHPTVAGVAMGLLFASYAPAEEDLTRTQQVGRSFISSPSAERARALVRSLTSAVSENERLALRLHPVVGFAVVPLFALANAGVRLDADALRTAATSRVAIGIVLGLVVGKLVGIVAGTWFALRLPASSFVGGVRWGQVTGIASVAGIGFTIALFITELAFDDPLLQQDAKIGILFGSVLAAVLALAVFRFLSARGGLCLPGDETATLPPLAQIPDPD